MNKIIIIAGPTASGKTNLSVEIAKHLNTDIISCDSMQIYKGMDIGTAKVSTSEMQGVKHHMIDIVNPDQPFSVSDYFDMVKPIIDKLHAENKIPLICGGTGLYIDAILYPLTMGAKDESIRNKLQLELEQYGPEYMHNKLKEIDPLEAEKIHANNTKRVLRALEIYQITGQIKSDLNDRSKQLNYETLLISLDFNRDELYNRINKRVDIMFENGLESEVRRLLNDGYSFDMQSMQAIGYKEFKDYFVNNLTIEEVKELIKKNTRHYAKRQITWFKRYDFANWINPNNTDKIFDLINDFRED